MALLCNVQQKIPCVFQVEVKETKKSKKWNRNTFQVSASDQISPETRVHLSSSIVTEKIDGTSCFVTVFRDKCWLWVRRDRKPTKNGEKRCKVWKTKHDTEYQWDCEKDIKEMPENWIPMLGISKDKDEKLLPLSNGHIPGWIPIDATSRTHCWHLSALDLDEGLISILRLSRNNDLSLELTVVKLNSLEGKTLELIGTNINGNPYELGSKAHPFHIFIEHGVIPIDSNVPLESSEVVNWFDSPDGKVEGVVWHTSSGKMFKIHRHHFGLDWPLPNSKLSHRIVRINLDEVLEPSSCDLINIINKNHGSPPLPLYDFISRLFSDENEIDVCK